MKGFKTSETLKITFVKPRQLSNEEEESDEEFIQQHAYFNSKAKIILNEYIPPALKKSQEQILNKIQGWISEGSAWTIMSINNHCLNLIKYRPQSGHSYIILPNELKNAVKGLIK